ncbi:MAG: phosphoribosylanthranilate isomerase, partial [bacterium]|nr:phosphoribosylanthranilate isomerase [bacterium]
LDYIQLHGSEGKEYIRSLKGFRIIKALQVGPGFTEQDLVQAASLPVRYVLLDTARSGTAGGTGLAFSWASFPFIREHKNIIISGGLNQGNIPEAIRFFRPAGLDINSGAELRPGIKSKRKINRILKKIRNRSTG